jgi:hypothetical protein
VISIVALAAASRAAVVVWATVAAAAGAAYDTSASLRRGDVTPAPPRAWDAAVGAVARPLTHWDAAYFVHLAAAGGAYEYEQFFAFFPGFPAAVRAVRCVDEGVRVGVRERCRSPLTPPARTAAVPVPTFPARPAAPSCCTRWSTPPAC